MTDAARPRSILGLLARLVWLRRGVALPLAGLAILLFVGSQRACPEPGLRVATFNIRNFPESPGQIDGAFETIKALEVPVIAVQEINDPVAFAAAAKRQLGKSWRAEFGPYAGTERPLLPGVLYNGYHYELDYARLHRGTQTKGSGRPVLEVRLFDRNGGPTLRVFVVHLRAGGDGVETRRAQLQVLTGIVRRSARGGDQVIVMGDFNSTGEVDRVNLGQFAGDTGLHWTTQELGCTAYWRPQNTCLGSALDHVFTSRPAGEAVARGPCESVGCEPGESCPVFYDQVSDHCPVTVAF
ncbi:hypothetical protein DB30_03851 [Enhygromyxa salina]|uniref:Endonuclease/exonuclease/phosphatase domain-containing protein n=1 Tax=Enhygromyxa salina TaxID=215803 RepID=A0A0C2DD08_9BACT|nr:endonuclease/exonuclease/phosphatase family protein [Enhygromyxa salina]KIG19295.1 hypothetical protein DB30_03851 [Enhygromyxa salina]